MTFQTNFRRLMLIGATLAVAMAPLLAEAKAGRGTSMGSRGQRTYVQPQGTTAQPMQRSITPSPSTVPPSAAQPQQMSPQPSTTPRLPPAAPAGFFQRHPFLGGLMGGLVGAGIGSLLFGGHFFGEGLGGLIGVVLQILLVIFVARLAISFFRRGSAVATPVAVGNARAHHGPVPVATPGGATRPRPQEFALGQEDLASFERLLIGIQAAWSSGDIPALKRLCTAEMASYFASQIEEERARGLENHVEQVRLMKGDVNETWREETAEYATVTMAWSAIDYTTRRADGSLVDGDPRRPDETTEVWTLLRGPGSGWQLSAIQQV